MREQAPIHGLAGISEGATVGSILLVGNASGDACLQGICTLSLISICALTSPAHARIYDNRMANSTASLHLVGENDTRDVHHMVGRTAALFGSGSGVGCFTGGHKLPMLGGSVYSQLEHIHFTIELRGTGPSSHPQNKWSKHCEKHKPQLRPAGRICLFA